LENFCFAKFKRKQNIIFGADSRVHFEGNFGKKGDDPTLKVEASISLIISKEFFLKFF